MSTDPFTASSYHYQRARSTARRTVPLARSNEPLTTALALVRVAAVGAFGSFALGLAGGALWLLF